MGNQPQTERGGFHRAAERTLRPLTRQGEIAGKRVLAFREAWKAARTEGLSRWRTMRVAFRASRGSVPEAGLQYLAASAPAEPKAPAPTAAEATNTPLTREAESPSAAQPASSEGSPKTGEPGQTSSTEATPAGESLAPADTAATTTSATETTPAAPTASAAETITARVNRQYAELTPLRAIEKPTPEQVNQMHALEDSLLAAVTSAKPGEVSSEVLSGVGAIAAERLVIERFPDGVPQDVLMAAREVGQQYPMAFLRTYDDKDPSHRPSRLDAKGQKRLRMLLATLPKRVRDRYGKTSQRDQIPGLTLDAQRAALLGDENIWKELNKEYPLKGLAAMLITLFGVAGFSAVFSVGKQILPASSH